jgi:hypothetical protein
MKNIQKNEKYKSRDLKLKSAKVLPKAKYVRFFTNFSELFQFSILIKYVIEVAIFLFFFVERSLTQFSGRFYHYANQTNTKKKEKIEIRN